MIIIMKILSTISTSC